jgi:hypothetical protein
MTPLRKAMALVSRRTLQRLIRENSVFTTLAQRERQAAALNRADSESLSVEWEILVLNGLARRATIRHEAPVGRRFPDVLARIGSGETAETFIADIATVFGDANAWYSRSHRKGTFVRSLTSLFGPSSLHA